MTKARQHTLFIYLSFFIIILLMMINRDFRPTHDDVWFPQVLQQYESIFDFLKYRYESWSGRILIDLTLPYVLKTNVWLWRLLNTAALTLLLAAIIILANLEQKVTGLRKQWIFAFGLFFLIFISKGKILEDGVFWATGSMNYLWPTACLCLALIPYSRLIIGNNDHNVAVWLGVACFGTFASYQEQTSLILICFCGASLLICFFRFRILSWPGLLIFLLFTINFTLLISAPGNILRYIQEMAKYFPHFNTLTVADKLLSGVNYTLLNHFFYLSIKQFIFIPLLTVVLAFKRQQPPAVKILALLPLFYTLLCWIVGRELGNNLGVLLNLDIYEPLSEHTPDNSSSLHLPPIVIGLSVLLSIPICWLRIFTLNATCLRLTLFYFAGIFSSFILSFSPTIFASGYRIFFTPDVMVLIVILTLFNHTLEHIKINGKLFSISYCLLALYSFNKAISLIL